MGKKNKKKSTFFSDFKAFITKGNIMDMAVGVVIGGAFSAIVNSLVNDIIMPLLTLATGDGVQGLSLVLNNVDKYLADGSINPEAVLWNYGNFLQSIINFLIIAICIFTTLRIIMNLKKASEKIAEKAKHSDETAQAEQAVAQEAVADVAEESKTDNADAVAEVKVEEVQEQPVEEVNAEEQVQEVAEEVKADEVIAEVEKIVEAKETQEDLLKQIRDLLATMQPQKSTKTTTAKSATKSTTAKKSTKSAK